MKKYLLVDMSNILYRAFFGNIKSNNDIVIPLCHHSALMSLRALDKKYKVDDIVAIFDSFSWRKEYTATKSISKKKYKGNRRSNLTPKQQQQFEVFDEHINLFYEFLKKHSSLIVLKADKLETDDLVEMFITEHPNDEHIIISTDKDFMQLLGRDRVSLVDPATFKERTLAEYDYDANYFMFQKKFRGDDSDNVQAAYPRIRTADIKKAYTDPYFLANKLEHVFEVEYFDKNDEFKSVTYKTKELFEENEVLMDLTKQPSYIRQLAKEEIEKSTHNRGSFDLIKFVKFCKEYELERVFSEKSEFSKLLMKRGK